MIQVTTDIRIAFYRGRLTLQDKYTGEPKTIWICKHEHPTYDEAWDCAKAQIDLALAMIEK